MRIFLAGGSGTIGSRLIPSLIEAGHSVVATTRWTDNVDYLGRLGATGTVVATDIDVAHLSPAPQGSMSASTTSPPTMHQERHSTSCMHACCSRMSPNADGRCRRCPTRCRPVDGS